MGGKIFGEQSELIYSINMLFLIVVCENQLKAFSIGSPMTAVMEFINDLVFNATAPDLFLLSAQYLELQHFERKIFMFLQDL